MEQNERQATQTSDPRNQAACGYTVIPPKETKRSKLISNAQKEVEDYERWKREHRPGPFNLPPEKLGGGESMAAVRQRQQMEAYTSKLQKKLKKEEMDRKRRQAEEEENQEKKAIQREKANLQKIRDQQKEKEREAKYRPDQQMKREEHLQSLEMSRSVFVPTSSSTPASSWARGHTYSQSRKAEEQKGLQEMKNEQRRKSDVLEEKQKQLTEDRKKELEVARMRVNSAFLDKLEARGSGRESELISSMSEAGNVGQREEPQEPALSPVPTSSFLESEYAEDEEEDHDVEWIVMKLQSEFPYYEPEALQEILSQCENQYQKAYDLLNV